MRNRRQKYEVLSKGDTLTVADIHAAVKKLEECSIPPCVCASCGEKFYVHVGAQFETPHEGATCGECDKARTEKTWNEAEPREHASKYTRWSKEFGRWINHPGTWPERATDEGEPRFCLGSPLRFREHEYVEGACRWCPRRQESEIGE